MHVASRVEGIHGRAREAGAASALSRQFGGQRGAPLHALHGSLDERAVGCDFFTSWVEPGEIVVCFPLTSLIDETLASMRAWGIGRYVVMPNDRAWSTMGSRVAWTWSALRWRRLAICQRRDGVAVWDRVWNVVAWGLPVLKDGPAGLGHEHMVPA